MSNIHPYDTAQRHMDPPRLANTHADRQHLARRHLESNRCTRCWSIPVDLENHIRKKSCPMRNKPAGDIFMTPEQGSKLSECKPSDPDAWYHMYQLLILGVENLDSETLKSKISPCKSRHLSECRVTTSR